MCRDLIDRKGPITLGKEKVQRKKRRKERAWRVCGDRKGARGPGLMGGGRAGGGEGGGAARARRSEAL